MSIKNNYRLFNKYTIVLVLLVWTVVIFAFLEYNRRSFYEYADQLALNEAQVSVKKAFAYRAWVASHGGVYVPITKRTPPNPYLTQIKNRDVITNDHQQLTLMNPAYALSQMMKDYTKLYGIKTKITSSKLINPNNRPDTWEKKALNIIEHDKKPFYEKSNLDGQMYLRYINPMFIDKSCLKCHAAQGYKIGDVRGGISIAVPLTKRYQKAYAQSLHIAIFLIFIWILGLALILFVFKKIQQNFLTKLNLYEQNIYSLVDLMEQRDSYTAGHTRRVAHYARLIAKQMEYDEDTIQILYRASMLHDIGKISTPDSILLKPGKLSQLEYSLIQEHVTTGYNVLKNMDFFRDLAEIVRHHHERYDGLGYPQKLKGDQVPLLSYIMGLADAFDAMTTDRIYKGRKSVEEALEEIKMLSGKQFHPQIVNAALIALKDVKIEQTIYQNPHNSLEKARFVYFYNDQLTGAYNREYLKFILQHLTKDEYRYHCAQGVYLRNFSAYNNELGWQSGDQLLVMFAQELRSLFPDALVFRSFGDDFIVLHKEFKECIEPLGFESLQDTFVTVDYRYIDLRNLREDIRIEEFETMLHSCC